LPYSSSDIKLCAFVKNDGQTVQIRKDSFECKEFRVDHAFGPTSNQGEVYAVSCKDVVEDVINGYNGCVIAYGQTGKIAYYSIRYDIIAATYCDAYIYRAFFLLFFRFHH
jgi:hypothetical protein